MKKIQLVENKFVLVNGKKPANQNTLSNKYFVLIEQFWNTSIKIVL
jgi:hypothetical protein